jgi:hypothetical protein
MRLSPYIAALALGVLGCEPNLGSPCDPDEAKVLGRMQVEPGKTDLVLDVAFDGCDIPLCASTNGSRPYCTKQCEADVECAEGGAGFTCQAIVSFGALACVDYTPLDQCDADGNGDGFPCDCIDENGAPSRLVKKYCAASPETIAARDEEYDRPPFAPPTRP